MKYTHHGLYVYNTLNEKFDIIFLYVYLSIVNLNCPELIFYI